MATIEIDSIEISYYDDDMKLGPCTGEDLEGNGEFDTKDFFIDSLKIFFGMRYVVFWTKNTNEMMPEEYRKPILICAMKRLDIKNGEYIWVPVSVELFKVK